MKLTEEKDGTEIPTLPSAPTPFRGCKYNKNKLTYVFLNLTQDFSTSQVKNILRKSFDTWGNVTNLRFTEVKKKKNADIRISWQTGEHGDGSPFDRPSVLAHSFFPPPCGGPNAGEIHFNEAVSWTDEPTSTGPNLLSIAIHQIGHTLGLTHSSDQESIMNAFATQKISLSKSDIQGIQMVYGPSKILAR